MVGKKKKLEWVSLLWTRTWRPFFQGLSNNFLISSPPITYLVCRIPSAYQELADKDVPKVEQDGVRVSVIAGESLGVKSPVYTRTPTMYLDFTLSPGAVLHQAVPVGWNGFVYTLKGKARFGSEDVEETGQHHTLQMGEGDGISVWNTSDEEARFVLIAGQPLNESVQQYGPFVMNTKDQIAETLRDYQMARNGFEKARGFKSGQYEI